MSRAPARRKTAGGEPDDDGDGRARASAGCSPRLLRTVIGVAERPKPGVRVTMNLTAVERG